MFLTLTLQKSWTALAVHLFSKSELSPHLCLMGKMAKGIVQEGGGGYTLTYARADTHHLCTSLGTTLVPHVVLSNPRS